MTSSIESLKARRRGYSSPRVRGEGQGGGRTPRLLMLVVALAACGGGGDDDTMIDVDAAPADTQAPELRDVRATLEGDLGVTLELNSRDAEHVIPVAGTAEFTVLVRDDLDAVDAIAVELIDADDAAVDLESIELRNGLWRLRVAIAPGDQLRVRARDSAGNARTGDHALILPELRDAVVGAWETWFFDDTQTITHEHTATWDRDASDADGAFSESRPDTGVTVAGTWTQDGVSLAVDRRTRTGGADPDTDPDTIEQRRVGLFHIDPIYFALDPYQRTAGTSGVEGTWERTWTLHEPDQGELVLAEEVTETLEITTGTWTETRTVIDHRGASPVTTTTTRSGTWRIELNDNYTEAVGDFLVRQVTDDNGTPVSDAPETWELHIIRAGRLLISPMLRQ
jgi:hypothetical protein